ncbi:MAG: hypothetical protein LBH98_06435 [Chitinispirillales bacterium]|jgi:hypothetical protein|nr:hypothetical protein [Chitinispirillales bacterium]
MEIEWTDIPPERETFAQSIENVVCDGIFSQSPHKVVEKYTKMNEIYVCSCAANIKHGLAYDMCFIAYKSEYRCFVIRAIESFVDRLFEEEKVRKVIYTAVVGTKAQEMNDRALAKRGGRVVGIYKNQVEINGKFKDIKVWEGTKEDWYEKKTK